MRHACLALAAALLAAGASADEPPPTWVDRAREGAEQLGNALQQTLLKNMREAGPIAAVDACRIQAPEITQRVSAGEVAIGRTALKLRNPRNAPDAWEARMLADFDRRLAAGEDPSRIEAFAIRHHDRRRYGHWMKAIPTQGLCTTCHGEALNPDLAAAIDSAYPGDNARGFAVGDLRGAFSVEIELPRD